jgi:hypothetical protein
MAEQQTSLKLDVGYTAAPAVEGSLRAEIAQEWGLPLGQRVEVSLKAERCALKGVLELQRAQDFPWDARQALRLTVAGFGFSSREIESWRAL